MSFKTRAIRLKSRRNPFQRIKKIGGSAHSSSKLNFRVFHYLAILGLLVFGFFVVIKATVAAYRIASDFTPATVLEVLGDDLERDAHGYTNILLLGSGDSGNGQRAGANLIDSIMVASIDYEKNAVSMLSIPRDYYVSPGLDLGLDRYGKINQIYVNHSDLPEADRFEAFKTAAGELVDLDLQYYMQIDFKGFVEVVDSLGGIEIEVPQAINDSTYPNATDTGFSPFYIESGLQELDGETALKYARSRHTTSDYDRAARQQLILEAIRQKALSKDVLTSYDTLKDLFNAIDDNFETDLSLRELASFASFAEQLDRSHLVMKQLHDDPGRDGGFLYVPPRELTGSFALLPYGDDLELIHSYSNMIFHHREMYYDPAKIEILNASEYGGIASSLAYDLNRYGFTVENIDNYVDDLGERQQLPESYVEYYDWVETSDGERVIDHQETLEALRSFIQDNIKASINAYRVPDDIENPSDETVYEGNGIGLSIILGGDYETFLLN